MPPEIDETPPRPVVRAVAGSAFLALTGLTGHPSVVQEGCPGRGSWPPPAPSR